MTAYYNENDPKAAAWLRELIKQAHIAPGDVDERSIEDVLPAELSGYTQCHFFAGVGVWSYALRNAGWPDDRPVWTGSCPCQPFSAAGKGDGFADERHLWPHWFHLIQHGKPHGVPVYGEQVASSDGLAWLDVVCADMEREGYAVWPVDLCSAGVGSPNIRQRLYWVANSQCERGRSGQSWCEDAANAREPKQTGGMADDNGVQRERGIQRPAKDNRQESKGQTVKSSGFCSTSRMGDDARQRCGKEGPASTGHTQRIADAGTINGTEAVAMAKAARPVHISPFLFCTRTGAPYYDKATAKANGWSSMWQRFMKRLIDENKIKERFTEHDLRSKAGSDEADTKAAQRLLAHADEGTTRRFYRLKPERIKPAK
ncbi:MAG: hypothetical protein CMM94_00955 [Rickettsiales bacterium]|nr:hypothetical protein [Rickettsiales bacterium]